jgi:sugar O-acyltransferase (sialic acid O-acetyltransferase NeuD family)
MRHELSVVGSGSLSQEVNELARELDFEVLNFYVEEAFRRNPNSERSLGELISLPEQSAIVVAIGQNYQRFRIVEILKSIRPDFRFPTLVHPSSQVAMTAKIGQGCLILRNATISANARINDFVLINNTVIVEHEAETDEYSSLGPRSSMLGRATLGKFSFLGAHSCVLQDRTIGEQSMLGAMSLLTKDLPSNELWFGIPAKFHRQFDFEEDVYSL